MMLYHSLLAGKSRCRLCTRPVSYTHLDVYKRQEYNSKEKDVVTGVVQRYIGKNVSINLGKADALLTESEQIKGCLLYTSRCV